LIGVTWHLAFLHDPNMLDRDGLFQPEFQTEPLPNRNTKSRWPSRCDCETLRRTCLDGANRG
jgi:hypothetical protein